MIEQLQEVNLFDKDFEKWLIVLRTITKTPLTTKEILLMLEISCLSTTILKNQCLRKEGFIK